MTGYGKSKLRLGDKNYTVEIKSLNSKQLDLNFKIVGELREREIDIRKLIADKLIRGKIDLYFQEDKSAGNGASLNFSLIKQYYQQLQEFSKEQAIPANDLLPSILRFQDINKSEIGELNEEDAAALLQSIQEALGHVTRFRKAEGAELEKDLSERIDMILKFKAAMEPFEKSRIEKLRDRLRQDLQIVLPDEMIDKNRFEEELIYYLEKIDINEEKVRLETHCKYFREVLNEQSLEKGKKLGFIAQEIGREINTIGAKANDADVQRFVILMKEELEKIKEQSMNIL
jgi:uncharacterized protein (TIGR00255 family)